jgi:hypothetical protein
MIVDRVYGHDSNNDNQLRTENWAIPLQKTNLEKKQKITL